MKAIKKFLSVFMAVLMAASVFSCLGYAADTYTGEFCATASFAKTDDGSTYFDSVFGSSSFTQGTIQSYNDLKTAHASETLWAYMGVKVYEKNAKDNWEETDYYLDAGQDIKLEFYFKGNFYTTTAQLGFILSTSLFTIAADKLNVGGYNASNPYGALQNSLTNASVAEYALNSKSGPYKNTTSKRYLPTSIDSSSCFLGFIGATPMSAPYSVKMDSDEPIFSYETTVNSGLADGTVGYTWFEEGGLTLNPNKNYFTATADGSTATESTTKFASTTMTTANVYTADCNHKFTIGKPQTGYTIKYYNGTTEYTDLATTSTDGNVTLPAAQTAAEGMQFKEWNTQADGNGTSYAAGAQATVTANTDFYAIFEAATPKYDIVFDLDGKGTSSDTLTFSAAENDVITVPTVTANDGYKFTGWSPAIEGTTITVGTEGVTYKAQYDELYDITFTSDANGSLSGTKEYNNQENKTEITAPTPVANDGYEFDKWTSSVDGEAISGGKYVVNGKDVTFTANFKEKAKTAKATVTIVAGESNIPVEIDAPIGTAYDVTTDAAVIAAIPAGYELDTEATTVTTITATEAGPNEITITCKLKSFDITFTDGETTKVKTYTYGTAAATLKEYAETELTKTGYNISWDKDFADVTEAATYTATWTAKKYTIIFKDATPGTNEDVKVTDAEYDQLVSKYAPDWTLNGYSLSWKDENEKAINAENENTTIAGNATYTAVWTAGQETITYYVKKGSASREEIGTATGAFGTEIGTKAITAPEYAGWELIDTDHVYTTFGEGTEVTYTYKLIDYTINFWKDAEKTNKIANFTKNINETIEASEVTTPTKTGYDFKGWKDADGADVTLPLTVTGSVEIFAQFEAAEQTATFKNDNGTTFMTKTAVYNTKYTIADDVANIPTKAGYIFKGWKKGTETFTYTAGQAFEFTMGVEDVYTPIFEKDNSQAIVTAVENLDQATYYDVDKAEFKFTFTQNPIALAIKSENGNTQTVTYNSWLAIDDASAIKVVANEENEHFWTVELVLPAGNYTAVVTYDDNGETKVEEDTAAYGFTVEYTAKPVEEQEVSAVTKAAAQKENTTATVEGYDLAVKSGSRVKYTITSTADVYYIRVVTTCEDGSTYTNLYKQTTSGVEGFSYESGTWTIAPIYSTDKDSETQTTKFQYKLATSTVWTDFAGENAEAKILVKKELDAKESTFVEENASVKVGGVTVADKANITAAPKADVELVTAANVQRIRIVWVQDGKTKNATYTINSKTCSHETNAENDSITWKISDFKFIAGTEYTIQTRVDAWENWMTFTATAE